MDDLITYVLHYTPLKERKHFQLEQLNKLSLQNKDKFGNLPLGKKIIHVLWSNMTKTPIQKKIMLYILQKKENDLRMVVK